jgi:hypothetical protein
MYQLKQDLQIVDREITANEFGGRAIPVLVAEADNGAASAAYGVDLGALGYAMDGR